MEEGLWIFGSEASFCCSVGETWTLLGIESMAWCVEAFECLMPDTGMIPDTLELQPALGHTSVDEDIPYTGHFGSTMGEGSWAALGHDVGRERG